MDRMRRVAARVRSSSSVCTDSCTRINRQKTRCNKTYLVTNNLTESRLAVLQRHVLDISVNTESCTRIHAHESVCTELVVQ